MRKINVYLQKNADEGEINLLMRYLENERITGAVFLVEENAPEQKMHPTNGGLSAPDSLSTPATISG